MSLLVQTLDQSAWGFDPRTLSECLLWLDASDTNTLFQDTLGTSRVTANGQDVKLWKDKSFNSNHATYVSSTAPTWDNSRGGVSFVAGLTAALDLCGTKLLGGTNPPLLVCMSIVSKTPTYPSLISNSSVITWGSNNYDGISFGTVNLSASSTEDYGFAYGGVTGSTTVGNVILDLSTTSRTVNIYNKPTTLSFQITSNKFYGWRDGSDFIGGSNGIAFSMNRSPVTTAKLGYSWGGTMNEIIVYKMNINDPSSTYIRTSTEGYLKWKWSTTSFGNTHPYYSRGPRFTTFRPTKISNCVLWMDAMDACYGYRLTSGTNNLSSVSDKSGKGATMTIGGTVSFVSNGLNNRGCFDFNSGRFKGTFATGNICTAYSNTTFMVGKWDSTPIAGYPAVTLADNINGGAYFYRCLDQATTARAVAFFPGGVYVPNITYPANANTLFLFTTSNTGISGQPMGISAYAGLTTCNVTVTVNTISNASNFFIGADGYNDGAGTNTTNSNTFPGKMGEVLIYNRILTQQEKWLVEGYLREKWGIRDVCGTIMPFSYDKVPPNMDN